MSHVPTLAAVELARRVRVFHDRWDQLAAAGLDDYQIRDRLIGCPDVTTRSEERVLKAADIPLPADPFQAAGQGMRDADQLTCDVHDVDPVEVWREMSRWTPTRLAMCALTLAAARPKDATLEADLDWVRDLDPTVIASARRVQGGETA